MVRFLFGYRFRRWALVIASCAAVGAGLGLARTVTLADAHFLWLLAPLVVLHLRWQNFVTFTFLVLFFTGLGWWRGSMYVEKLAVHQSLHYQKVVLVGRASDDAVYGDHAQLEFPLDSIEVLSPAQTPLVGSLTIRGFGEPAIYRGDLVQVEGKLFPTRGNALGSIGFADLHVRERDNSWINEARRRFAAGMQSALPEPNASFGLGLLIGQRSTLPDDTSDQLRSVGLTHIIAVSGYNLTIIVLACRRLLSKRSKFQATAACLVLIGLFLLLTGSSPPIVRASIISLLSIGAWYYGRNIRPLVLLLVAAAVTALASPLYVWGNVSWYLSFLAFFGVLVVAPLVTKRILGQKEPRMLAGIVIETLCASFVVLPYALFIFGQMSLVSLPANVLVIPFIPLAMLLALGAGLAGMLVPVVAGWFAWPAQMLLTYMLDVANVLSRVPHAFVEHIGFSAWAMTLSYVALGFVCLVLWSRSRKSVTITEKIAVREEV